VVDLVVAPDAAAEIDAPDVAGAPFEAEGLERNPDFRRPAVLVHFRCDRPHAVPAWRDVAALVGHLQVGLRGRRVRHEDEAVAAISERVDDDLEAVLFSRDEILSNVVDDRRLARSIEAPYAQVKRVGIEEDADLRRFARGLAFVRFRLYEAGRR